jgi:NAD(P)-dependent dehydrogenase (short-subunit alcohol dehydrogenase family)
VKTKSKSILITGANGGLGREAARRLVAAGHEVRAAARDPERGRAAAEEVHAHPLVLDVGPNGPTATFVSRAGRVPW